MKSVPALELMMGFENSSSSAGTGDGIGKSTVPPLKLDPGNFTQGYDRKTNCREKATGRG